MHRPKTRISIITSFFNEQGNLPEFRERLTSVLSVIDVEYEVVLVDDHSIDASPSIAKEWADEERNIHYLRFSRNFGSHAAASAGLRECTGDCVIWMSSDLQHPPETIPFLYDEWEAGNDVVWATSASRKGESWSTKFMSRMYYWSMKRAGLSNMPSNGADFVLLDRKVITAYNSIPEKNTSFLAMIIWMGFRQTSIEYIKQVRRAGKSKWTLAKKVKLFVDSIVSFSYAPIRLMSCFGAAMSLCGFIYALVVIAGRLTGWVTAGTGFAALMVVLLVGQGSIMLMLGVLGEYIWRAFDEARGRPRYIIEELVGSEADRHETQSDSSKRSSNASHRLAQQSTARRFDPEPRGEVR